MSRAMMEREMIISSIEQGLDRLQAPGRQGVGSRARISELRAIHKLAVKEKATQTADRLDKLIVAYQRGSVGRDRPPVPRRERPARQEKTK